MSSNVGTTFDAFTAVDRGSTLAVSTVSLSPTALTVPILSRTAIRATTRNAADDPVTGTSYAWSIVDPTVATVVGQGADAVVKALGLARPRCVSPSTA